MKPLDMRDLRSREIGLVTCALQDNCQDCDLLALVGSEEPPFVMPADWAVCEPDGGGTLREDDP